LKWKTQSEHDRQHKEEHEQEMTSSRFDCTSCRSFPQDFLGGNQSRPTAVSRSKAEIFGLHNLNESGAPRVKWCMQSIARRFLAFGFMSATLVDFTVWAAHAEALAVDWSHPAWATHSKPFSGEVHLDVPVDTTVYLHYATPGGPAERVPCEPAEGDRDAYSFSIPAERDPDANEISFWLETVHPERGAQTTKPKTVPQSEVLEIEVSGKTDEELSYPLGDWWAELLFKPCCLIISGWIAVERIPVLPTPTSEGLPDHVLTPYFRIDPDQLVEATGGVSVRVSYEMPAESEVTPDSIRPYHWKDSRWTPVFDAILDSENQSVTFPFVTGGIVAIGGNSSE
jgi:hypothetical protein